MSRTALEIVQVVATRIGLAAPTVLFSSTEPTDIELRTVLVELADRLVRLHDWSLLKTQETHAGDGVTEAYALPTDYLRMAKEGQIWSTRWERPLLGVTPEDFLHLEIRDYDLVVGVWTILGGQFQYRPALAADEDAKFYYVSKNVCASSSATPKAQFTADDDTFRLDDRMLELSLIWEWRQRKGLDYAEDMAAAEQAIAQQISWDRGARMITQASRHKVHSKVAYPWTIVP